MPDWCENTLEIVGHEEDLVRFIDFAKGISFSSKNSTILPGQSVESQAISLNKFLPFPYSDEEYDKKGYDWCCKNWGTKWDLCDVSLNKHEPNRLEYSFQTAWSPPIPAITAMSQQFPSLSFWLKYSAECGAECGDGCIFLCGDECEGE
jgi:hypothetical protein